MTKERLAEIKARLKAAKNQGDAELIAHAPRDLEDLVGALEVAQRQLEFYRQTYAGE